MKITAAIPVHPPRFHSTLPRALASVYEQTRPVDALAVTTDQEHRGAAHTRNRALEMVRTEWVAFLDSDDMWRPFHLDALAAYAEETGADLVFPHFDVVGGFDPFAQWEGVPFNPAELLTHNRIPVTVLARTDLLRDVGGFVPLNPDPFGDQADDWGCWRRVAGAGGKIVHLNRRTWFWHWQGGPERNTSGSGMRW